ncbi:hypothetical protein [Deinococcus altitudinis]|uniref:hypothetical protein n=1 Tax=Deinococcus altitudinis TaxID=468914 RepID=UPI003891CF99
MTQDVLKVAPSLAGRGQLAPGKVLEIHAVALYQSGEIFRAVNEVVPGYWHKQHEWIRRCLELGAGFGVEYISYATHDPDLSMYEAHTAQMADAFTRHIRYKNVKTKAKSIATNPYLIGLPVVLSAVDNFLQDRKTTGDVFCHTMESAVSFSRIDSFRIARERGHFLNIGQPAYRTCTQEPIIQLTDVVSYVILQARNAQASGTLVKPEFAQWFDKYIRPTLITGTGHPSASKQTSITRMFFELMAIDCGGHQDLQQAIRRTLPPILEKWGKGEISASGVFLTDQGLVEGEPQMYRPPSGDGDLSNSSLPEAGTEDKDEGGDSDA